MSLTYSIDTDRRLITITGDYADAEEWAQLLGRMVTDPQLAPGFAVLRDPIACKHAVLAETDDWVAMATEYRAIAHLPGAESARIWEPAPGIIYDWSGHA